MQREWRVHSLLSERAFPVEGARTCGAVCTEQLLVALGLWQQDSDKHEHVTELRGDIDSLQAGHSSSGAGCWLPFVRRHLSLQYLTSSQTFSHFFLL